MNEVDNDDENVWNASAVILDIDSGVLNEIYFSLTSQQPQPFCQIYINLSCQYAEFNASGLFKHC